MVLLINACARAASRTLPLAQKAAERYGDAVETVHLYRCTPSPLDEGALARRDRAVAAGDYGDAMFDFARQFQAADRIVVAAPYWDLSFPAVLKCYFENVTVSGLTFRYNSRGVPEGLCRATELIYVTTAGGYIPEQDYGYGYVRRLCADLFGIGRTVLVKAEGLDIDGADVAGILRAAEDEIAARIPATHRMNLDPGPFSMIAGGQKTIELRLFDEKRRKIRPGDTVVFTDRASGKTLSAIVVRLHRFADFAALYQALPLLRCGYTEATLAAATPADMERYYSPEAQKAYGVVGIELARQECD